MDCVDFSMPPELSPRDTDDSGSDAHRRRLHQHIESLPSILGANVPTTAGGATLGSAYSPESQALGRSVSIRGPPELSAEDVPMVLPPTSFFDASIGQAAPAPYSSAPSAAGGRVSSFTLPVAGPASCSAEGSES